MSAHRPYWHPNLQADFCESCGDEWPCWHHRQANPRCRCSHARITHSTRTGMCWQTPCACSKFEPQEMER